MRTLPKDVETVELPINSWVKLKCNEINTNLYRSSARNTHDIQWFKGIYSNYIIIPYLHTRSTI